MGRNTHPKLNEWRDGEYHRFRPVGSSHVKDAPPYVTPDDGRLIVYEAELGNGVALPNGHSSMSFATAYADGFESVMASMFWAGHRKGIEEGKRQALAEVRKVLGID